MQGFITFFVSILLLTTGGLSHADWLFPSTPNSQIPTFVPRSDQKIQNIIIDKKPTGNCAALVVKNANEKDETNYNFVDLIYETYISANWWANNCATSSFQDCGMPMPDAADIRLVNKETIPGKQIQKAMEQSKAKLSGSTSSIGTPTDCCRHHSMFLTDLLSSTGFTTSLKAGKGHAVVEAKKGSNTFIVDGLNGMAILLVDCKPASSTGSE